MKKIAIIAMALLALAGCTKHYSPNGYEIVGGNEYYSNYPSRSYMMAIVDNMITDALEELETAFKIEGLGNPTSLRFDITAGSILTEGVSWKVIGLERALKGMTLKNIGSDTWELSYEGPYSLLGDVYPVNFIMKAKRGSLITGNHYNWGVTINGNRTERNGYSCIYSSNNTVLYQCTQDNTVGWNYLEGMYSLTVFLNQEAIDLWAIEFHGVPSEADFSRGI
jgi:hypothetical protein